jgi:hypothetical protein
MVWRRLPTFFPNFPLRMMPLSEAQAAQVRETGWVREAAFRTEPHVNKVRVGNHRSPCADTRPPPTRRRALATQRAPPPAPPPHTHTHTHTHTNTPLNRQQQIEIKRFLETVYGARVERVATLNYEGKKKRRLDPRTGRPRWVRLPDWKKAYVVFRGAEAPPPPAGAGAPGSGAAAAAAAAAQEERKGRRWWLERGPGGGYPGRLADGWGGGAAAAAAAPVSSAAAAAASSAGGRPAGVRRK